MTISNNTYRTCRLPARIVFNIYTDDVSAPKEQHITFSFKTLVSCEIENRLSSPFYRIKLKNFHKRNFSWPDVTFPKYDRDNFYNERVTWDRDNHSIDYFLSNYKPEIDIKVQCFKNDTFVGCYPVYQK
jgi:hypothetical protein